MMILTATMTTTTINQAKRDPQAGSFFVPWNQNEPLPEISDALLHIIYMQGEEGEVNRPQKISDSPPHIIKMQEAENEKECNVLAMNVLTCIA